MCKECSKCGETKPLTDYHNRKVSNDGKDSKCKDCIKIINKERRPVKPKGTMWKLSLSKEGKKYCKPCDSVKSVGDFGKNKGRFDGLMPTCKICKIEIDKEYRNRLKDQGVYYERKRMEYENNKDKYKEWSKNRVRDYKKEMERRRELDPLYNFKHTIKTLIIQSFKYRGYKKDGRTEEILGCDYETLHTHMENLFTEGMNWDNKGMYGWHVDHKIPLATSSSQEDVIRLNHYTNLQPLWAEDNLSKGCKLDWVKE